MGTARGGKSGLKTQSASLNNTKRMFVARGTPNLIAAGKQARLAASSPSICRGIGRTCPTQHRVQSKPNRAARQKARSAVAMTEASVGEWKSPITSELITSSSIRLGGAKAGSDGFVYWVEARPSEGGRSVIMRQKPGIGTAEQLTPGPESGLNPRTRVHEYGGGEVVLGDDTLYFSNFADQRLYKQVLSPEVKAPEPLTPADTGLRFADGVVDKARNRIVTVQEDHSGEGEAVNTIAAVDTDSGASTVLVKGNDFYSNPRLSQDGKRLAWIEWAHPNMPWDDTELWVGELDSEGRVASKRKVAGGKDESVMQPLWTAEGGLVFISDRSGWWNLYLESNSGSIEALFPKDAEFGEPAWMFGSKSYALLSDGRILAKYSDPKAGGTVALIDPSFKKHATLSIPYASLGGLSVSEAGGRLLLATLGTSPKRPSVITALSVASPEDLATATPEDWTVLKASSKNQIDEGYLSEPTSIEYPTENGLTAFMNFYPPNNKDFKLPPGELPPLLVKIHGGPTSQASTSYNLLYQYWCSQGFAIADVNYGGSTGYGRAYRQRLNGQWGIVDVDDCANAAKHLAKEGKVDGKRLCIDGGSAGGYTTLAALAFRDDFSAGASLYGVADCELLAQETHKFESRYLDNLIGPYPEKKEIYIERSPIHSVDKFSAPCILFQGTEDKVVPMNQAVDMYEGLKAKGLVTALVLFEGEQHGFRGTSAIRQALDGELYFFAKALGFKAEMPGDDVPAPHIVNL